ncbi:hypothetical protein [Legionella cherrii]|uniref:Uncharacterized protein n=1 Tax=Legionella cherrii TaxID=28084 RepID=A0A0W0S7D1_9GAMM|nr:hypothetical protein [Legionella cherrii]KTC79033.1 hypothetical protein Lche_1053 [Legionella cherrii]VEB36413.1 Uncharacterised protein [Legionella cherrii]
MMSRNFLGFFAKPAKAVFETTLYSVGAAALGTGFYRAGNYINEQFKPQQENLRNQPRNQPESDHRDNSHQSEMKIGI